MALTDDQKAMLRVLAQREEGYEDMAALMGISVEELRQRVKGALSEVEDEADEAKPVEKPAPAGTEEAPSEPPEPAAATPVPPPPASRPAPPPVQVRPRRGPSGLKLPEDRGARLGLVGGLLAIVAMVVALIVAGGGSSSDTASTGGETSKLIDAISKNPNLTDAILTPAPGGEGEGVALFGRFGKAVVLEVAAKGLQQSEPGQSYAIWLAHSGEAMIPMGTSKASASGEIGARLQVPATALLLVAKRAFDEVQVTRVTDSRLKAAVAVARRKKAESAYTGTPVLRGQIAGRLIRAAQKAGR